MNIFVTGGGGFIGSHVVDALIIEGHNVVVVDNGESMCSQWINLQATYLHGDILDQDWLIGVMKDHRPDVVIHLAAHLEVTQSQADPVSDLMMNTGGTLRVLEAMKENGIKKLVNASSACVYGQVSEPSCVARTLPCPHWPYGASKLAAETYVAQYAHNFGMQNYSLRFGIVFGPREWYGRVLTNFFRKAKEGRDIVVFGDGSQIRDFTPIQTAVRDVINAVHSASVMSHAYHQIDNSCSGIDTTIAELAQMVAKITGVGIKFEQVNPGERDSSGRTRIPFELQAMSLRKRAAIYTMGSLYTKESLYKDLSNMWDWIQRTDLDSLKTWRVERV